MITHFSEPSQESKNYRPKNLEPLEIPTKQEHKSEQQQQQPSSPQAEHSHDGAIIAGGNGVLGSCPRCTAIILHRMADLMDSYSSLVQFVGEDEATRMFRSLQRPTNHQ